MADLVTLAEALRYIGDVPTEDEELVQDLLDHVEGLFETESGRTATSFRAAANSRTEVKDGTGHAELYLDFPVSALTSVKLGHDAADPVETLDVADPDIITFGAGSRRLVRTDGGVFGRAGQARYVQVVYNHQADLPEEAQLAIKSVCAIAYRRRGNEEATQDSIGGSYSRTMLQDIAASDPFWQRAVSANRRMILA